MLSEFLFRILDKYLHCKILFLNVAIFCVDKHYIGGHIYDSSLALQSTVLWKMHSARSHMASHRLFPVHTNIFVCESTCFMIFSFQMDVNNLVLLVASSATVSGKIVVTSPENAFQRSGKNLYIYYYD